MLVVGGSYTERTVVPRTEGLWGSGLKAAAAASSFSRQVKLVTAASHRDAGALRAIADTFRFEVEVVPRTAPIEFEYFTPVARPQIGGLQQPAVKIQAESRTAVQFGMLESVPVVRSDTLVFDPQSPTGALFPAQLRNRCERLAIVLNAHEARVSFDRRGLDHGASRVLRRTRADVVVIKCGALGAVVKERGARSSWVPSFQTPRAWPIGTGDVFTSIFAWSWGQRGHRPAEAARLASLATAWWSATQQFPIPRSVRVDGRLLLRALPSRRPRVYLAGPFFGTQEEWLVHTVRGALQDVGADVFSPLHDVGRGAEDVARKDLLGLRSCSSVLALLDRVDVGTVFEAGYARSLGIPVVGFVNATGSDDLKMLRGSGVSLFDDLSTAVYQAVWAGM